jgi:predicted N-acyltransferase
MPANKSSRTGNQGIYCHFFSVELKLLVNPYLSRVHMQIEVFDNLVDVPREKWNQILEGQSRVCSYEFCQVVEQSRLNDFDYLYLLISDDAGRPLGLACSYTITTDLAIFSPRWLKRILEKVRALFPGFLRVRMQECGTPITLAAPIAMMDRRNLQELVTAIAATLEDIARRRRAFLIVVRDFDEPDSDMMQAFSKRGYRTVDNLPNTCLDIEWNSIDEYTAAMKSYYRSKLLRHVRRIREQGVTCSLVEDFDHLAEQLCEQWLTVHNQADEYQREVITPEFYREFSRLPGGRSRVLLFHRAAELIGHAVLFFDDGLLRWLFFGRSRAANDSLYMFAGYKVIETAIDARVKHLELGLTTYSVKKDLGARMVPLRMALKSPRRFVNPFIAFFYPLLNSVPAVQNRSVFKKKLP